jgi:hypothetical protein
VSEGRADAGQQSKADTPGLVGSILRFGTLLALAALGIFCLVRGWRRPVRRGPR